MNEKKQKSNSFSVAVFFLTVILIIQVFLVLYPLAFTISASFSESNSLASTSIVLPSEAYIVTCFASEKGTKAVNIITQVNKKQSIFLFIRFTLFLLFIVGL